MVHWREPGAVAVPTGSAHRRGEVTAVTCLPAARQVTEIVMEGEGDNARAVGVRLADGRVFRGKSIVSNATRWDTFGALIPEERLPKSERLFRQRYKKSPSFFSMHLGVRSEVLPPGALAFVPVHAHVWWTVGRGKKVSQERRPDGVGS